MKTRIILQDNLWFRAGPRFSNYRLNGRWMVPVRPRLGFTDSHDVAAKTQELRWLLEYTGERGQGLVIAQEWIQPNDRLDRVLRQVWLPLFEKLAPEAKWCIFYDPVLASRQRNLVRRRKRVDFAKPEVLDMWRRDLDYLTPYMRHKQYWRLAGGRPALYVWAGFALKRADRAFRLARQKRLYVLADVMGSTARPDHANGLTGFTAALPSLERRRHRLKDLLPLYEDEYRRLASAPTHHFIPAGSCQYDDTAFMRARQQGEQPLSVCARHQREVEAYLRLALSYSRPIGDTRYLMWGTLNNWAEGTTVLPTADRGARFSPRRLRHYRFAHLDAIRRAVFSG